MYTLIDMQQAEVKILKEIHTFCKDHNLRYSLGYGTLLGAVRHKGFIPWDDDMDILMPRPDYDRFLSTFMSESYKAVSLKDPDYFYPYAKVYDKRTYLVEELRNIYPDMGVFVDIFPVDGIPDDSNLQIELYKKQQFLYKLHMSMKYRFSREWGIKKNFLLGLSRCISILFPLKKVLNRLDQNSRKYDFLSNKESAVLVGEQTLIPLSENAFDELVELPFDDVFFLSIPDYERILGELYGDYMTPPSIENQVTEHRYQVGLR